MGALIFSPTGAILPSYMLAHGEISDELLEEGIEDPAFAAALAVPVAGLDAIGASRVTAPVRKEAIKRLIKTGTTKTPLRLGGAATESGTEGGQKLMMAISTLPSYVLLDGDEDRPVGR